jgi:hypothetical protein
MKTMAAIDLSVAKEVTLDADVGELLNGRIEIAMVGLGAIAQHCLHTSI